MADRRSGPVERSMGDRLSVAGWPLSALLVAALVVAPIGFLATSILAPNIEVWRQQWSTRLPGQLIDTAVLLAGVGVGTLVLGGALAWLTSAYRFPGSRLFGWLLITPLPCPAMCSVSSPCRWWGSPGRSRAGGVTRSGQTPGSPTFDRWVALSSFSRLSSTPMSSCSLGPPSPTKRGPPMRLPAAWEPARWRQLDGLPFRCCARRWPVGWRW